MKRNFLELQNFLANKYHPNNPQNTGPIIIESPGSVTGELYPPPPLASFLAQVFGILQIVGMAVIVLGDTFFNLLGFAEPPAFYKEYVAENKVQVFLGLFLANAYISSFTATGAFEVYFNDTLVYSKLETGRMPNLQQIIGGIESLMQQVKK